MRHLGVVRCLDSEPGQFQEPGVDDLALLVYAGAVGPVAGGAVVGGAVAGDALAFEFLEESMPQDTIQLDFISNLAEGNWKLFLEAAQRSLKGLSVFYQPVCHVSQECIVAASLQPVKANMRVTVTPVMLAEAIRKGVPKQLLPSFADRLNLEYREAA